MRGVALSASALALAVLLAGCGGDTGPEAGRKLRDPIERTAVQGEITAAADELSGVATMTISGDATPVDLVNATEAFVALVRRYAGPETALTARFDLRRARVTVHEAGCSPCVSLLDDAREALDRAVAGKPRIGDVGEVMAEVESLEQELRIALSRRSPRRVVLAEQLAALLQESVPTISRPVAIEHLRQAVLATDAGRCRACSKPLVAELRRLAPYRPVERVTAASANRFPAPPTPRVTAKRMGEQVAFTYQFDRWPQDRRREPWLLLTSVDPAGDRYPPLTYRHAVRGRSGRVVRPLGLGRAPFIARVSVLARTGARSRTVALRLR
jgi:hypothetical protein